MSNLKKVNPFEPTLYCKIVHFSEISFGKKNLEFDPTFECKVSFLYQTKNIILIFLLF